MSLGRIERILILAKTYPSPSAQYVETSCVAGITELGAMRRLYPLPFRMLEEGRQFKKWQWIDVRVEKARKDTRTESHKVYVDTITCGDVIDTKRNWSTRWPWLEKIPTFRSFDALDRARRDTGLSIGLVVPKALLGLDVVNARHKAWTAEEEDKLMRAQMQDDLFSEADAKRQVKSLRKVPFDFYYRYLCETPHGDHEYRHKIVDWEAGALYWNCSRNHGSDWEVPFRAKLEGQLGGKELMFLMGNLHRFRTQWLIIGLVYPPTRSRDNALQGSLF